MINVRSYQPCPVYTGQASWRTRVRAALRVVLPFLALSDEEWLMRVCQQLAPKRATEGKRPIKKIRIAHVFPQVLLAADGKTTFRYVIARKNASSSIGRSLVKATIEKAGLGYGPPHDSHIFDDFTLNFKYGNRIEHLEFNGCALPHFRYWPEFEFSPNPTADIRFCVVRDPVTRFLSGFKGHIKVSEFHGLSDITLEQYITKLEQATEKSPRFLFDNPDFTKHLRPQSYFLGDDASFYTHVFTLQDMGKLSALLSELLGETINLEHRNTLEERMKLFAPEDARKDVTQMQATPKQQERIRKLYAADYKAFGKYFK